MADVTFECMFFYLNLKATLFFTNCTCENKTQRAQSLWTPCQSVVLNDRCSTRFRSDDRVWSQVSDTCHQTVMEKNVSPCKPYATDRFLPHTSIQK